MQNILHFKYIFLKAHLFFFPPISQILRNRGQTHRQTCTFQRWNLWIHHLQRKWHQRHHCVWAPEIPTWTPLWPRYCTGLCARTSELLAHFFFKSVSCFDWFLVFSCYPPSHPLAAPPLDIIHAGAPTETWCPHTTSWLLVPFSVSSTTQHWALVMLFFFLTNSFGILIYSCSSPQRVFSCACSIRTSRHPAQKSSHGGAGCPDSTTGPRCPKKGGSFNATTEQAACASSPALGSWYFPSAEGEHIHQYVNSTAIYINQNYPSFFFFRVFNYPERTNLL